MEEKTYKETQIVTGTEAYIIFSNFVNHDRGNIEIANCDFCKRQNVIVTRKTYYYDILCECCSPSHFATVRHCSNCTPKEPEFTTLTVKTKFLKLMSRWGKFYVQEPDPNLIIKE